MSNQPDDEPEDRVEGEWPAEGLHDEDHPGADPLDEADDDNTYGDEELSSGELETGELDGDDAGLAGFAGRRVAFVGRLGGVSRREASRLIREQGGSPLERCEVPVDIVVCGAEEDPLADPLGRMDRSVHEAIERGEIEVLSETQFWQRLGLMENEPQVRRLYTPAMLARLLHVPVTIIRRWHRRGLIVPEREVHRLPYFDFQEVATARRLAELLAAGDSPEAIERKLAALARSTPGVERPLAQLSVIVQGRQLLLRQGEGLIEPSGQRRLDFEARQWDANAADPAEDPATEAAPDDGPTPARPRTLPINQLLSQQLERLPTAAELLSEARQLEDEGQVLAAVEAYRAALLASGPNPEICFQLAELLYLAGDIGAARERYSMAIELDENFVEARANLGCILLELGQVELAIAAFQGALSTHADYPDVHYHLARSLDRLGRPYEAEPHWRQFLRLAPDSPWAEEATLRLGLETPADDSDAQSDSEPD